jgi:II/X family phage/plasmid replication protein
MHAGAGIESIGLDKIRLYTNDFSVLAKANLQIKPHNVDMSTGRSISNNIAYYTHHGIPIEGKGAFNNTDGVNLDIEHGYLAIEFNPLKRINGNNYFPIDSEKLNESIDQIAIHVKDTVGINFNINNAKVSRLDICRNIETERPFIDYLGALDTMIDPKYMRVVDSETYSGYWKKKNRSRQYVLYDKLHELRIRQKVNPKTLGIRAKNVLRGELRFMNSRTVRNALETMTINQLRESDHLHHLTDRYKAIITKDVFKYNSEMGVLPALDDLRASLLAVHDKYKRDTITHWLATNTNLREYSLPFIRQVIESAGIMNRQNIHKNMQKVRQLFGITGASGEMPSYEQLIDEIHAKLVA